MNRLEGIRFTIMLAELLVVLLIPVTMVFSALLQTNNVAAAGITPSMTEFEGAQTLVLVFVGITAVFLFLQMIIMVTGINKLSKRNTAYRIQANKIEILGNLLALILYAWFILDSMNYKTIWYIWIVFNLLPFISQVGLMVVNLIYFRKYEKVYE